MKRLGTMCAAMALCGCAVLGKPAADQVAPRRIAGLYYQGDGLGTNVTVNLAADGTYQSKWHGCLGEYGSSIGRWSLVNGLITFEPAGETDMLVGYLRQAQVKRSWPRYKLVPVAGKATREEVLLPIGGDVQ